MGVDGERWRLNLLWLGGLTYARPSKDQALHKSPRRMTAEYICMLAAGPAVNFMTYFLVKWALTKVCLSARSRVYLNMLAYCAIDLGAFNICPLGIILGASDGFKIVLTLYMLTRSKDVLREYLPVTWEPDKSWEEMIGSMGSKEKQQEVLKFYRKVFGVTLNNPAVAQVEKNTVR